MVAGSSDYFKQGYGFMAWLSAGCVVVTNLFPFFDQFLDFEFGYNSNEANIPQEEGTCIILLGFVLTDLHRVLLHL